MGADEVVLLSPILALAVVLLLGFAGCDEIFDLEHVDPADPVPPPPPPFLTLRARVPRALVVTELTFVWGPPSGVGGSKTDSKPNPTGIEGDVNVFDLALMGGALEEGTWTVDCTVKVQGGTGMGASASGMPVVDGSVAKPVVAFRASGEAMTLMLMYSGLESG